MPRLPRRFRSGPVCAAATVALLLCMTPAHGYRRYYDGGFTWSSSFGELALRGQRSSLPPCPEYKPMYVTQWNEPAGDRALLRVVLPGVGISQRKVWLSDDGKTLHVYAVRALPARGVSCMPSNARISSNGRYEFLDASVVVPPLADAGSTRLRQFVDELWITMPMQKKSDFELAVPPETHPEAHEQTRMAVGLAASRAASPLVLASHELANATSDGVEVIDEESSWPEKNDDAVEGWWDNRGEFHLY